MDVTGMSTRIDDRGQGRMSRGYRACRRLPLAAGVALLALAFAAPAAQGAPGDPFTPQFSFSTSTTQAGAHPDMKVEMHKAIKNHCRAPAPPYTYPGHTCTDLYLEQNLKQMTVHFPPGAIPDPNAAPYCGLRRSLYPPPMNVDMPEVYYCENEDALVGVVDATTQLCSLILSGGYGRNFPDGCSNTSQAETFGCQDPQVPPPGGFTNFPTLPPSEGYTYQCRTLGYVYNEAPRLDDKGLPIEQGHLVVLLPRWPHPDDIASWIETGVSRWNDPSFYERVGGYASNNVTHTSVRVRKADVGIDSTADVPDWVPLFTGPYPSQVSDIVLTLFGSTGAERGHPLLTNPTFCDPQAIDAEFLGYAHNAQFAPHSIDSYVPGFGDGKTVTDSVGVQATGCDQVPYAPNLDLKLSTTKASEVPAVEATMTQPQGEATNQSSTVTFPSGFKINDKNKATFCGDADIQRSVDDPDRDFCPESSRVGTVEASSYVLPEWEPPLKGGVYLKGLTGDAVEFSALLEGFVDIRFDAKGKLGDDLRITNRFENLPSVPVSKFVLKLEGGQDKGMLKNPKICGTQTVRSVFESHSHKQAIQDIPFAIEGCTDPFLDAELSTRKPGASADLDLSLSPSLTPVSLGSAEFQLARHLHWGIKGKAEAAKKKAKTVSVGSIVFTTTTKDMTVPLAAKRTKNGNINFTPLQRGGQSLGELSAFSASLIRTNRRQPNVTARGKSKRTGKRTRRQADLLILSGMPKGDLTGVELSLKGTGKNRSFYLKNPKGCRRPLNFVARATTTDGRRIALADRVRLRGTGCPKR